MRNTTTQGTAKSQLDKFKETAREVETDDSEEAFDRALRRVARPDVSKEQKQRPKPSKSLKGRSVLGD